jgi:hypothetical protein
MPTAQEVYENTIRPLPPAERLRLAALILEELTAGTSVDVSEGSSPQSHPSTAPSSQRRSMLELLESLPPGPRLFKTPEEADRYIQEERDSWDR